MPLRELQLLRRWRDHLSAPHLRRKLLHYTLLLVPLLPFGHISLVHLRPLGGRVVGSQLLDCRSVYFWLNLKVRENSFMTAFIYSFTSLERRVLMQMSTAA